MALEYVNLTLDLVDGQGNVPKQGTAIFTLSGELFDTVDHADIIAAPITVAFDTSGVAPVVKLLANDSPNMTAGSGWTVTFNGFPGNTPPATRTFILSYADGSDQFLSSQVQAELTTQATTFLEGAYPGNANEYLDGSGNWSIPPSVSGGGTGAVSSVNTKTGDVVLSASDVGAWAATKLAGPSSAQTTVWSLPNGDLLVLPLSTYGLTGDDGQYINDAINALPVYLSYPSGKIRYVNGTYTLATGLTNCPYVRHIGAGQGTIFKYTGTGKAVYAQNTRPSDTQTDYRLSGGFEDIVLDISTAGANAYGIYLDSTQGYWLRCTVVGNPSSTTQAGVWVANDSHSLNSLYGYCHIQDCGQALTFSTSGTGSAAQERIDVKWKIQIQNGQTGVTVRNGMQVQQSQMSLHVNNDQHAVAAFNFVPDSGGSPSNFQNCNFLTRIEPLGTGAGNWSNPTVVAAKFGNTNCGWKDSTGIMFVSPNMPSSATAGTVGKVVWGGVLSNDAGLSAAQTKPSGWL